MPGRRARREPRPGTPFRRNAIGVKAKVRKDIVKYMQEATPLTMGEELTGYEGVLPATVRERCARLRCSSIKITNDIRLKLANERMGSFLSHP